MSITTQVLLPITLAIAAMPTMAEVQTASYTVNNGEVFNISLPSNPLTGNIWMLRTLPEHLTLASYAFKKAQCEEGMTGCNREQVFVFKSEKIGLGTIDFSYGRITGREVKHKLITVAVE